MQIILLSFNNLLTSKPIHKPNKQTNSDFTSTKINNHKEVN